MSPSTAPQWGPRPATTKGDHAKPKEGKKRPFLWFFLAVQALFIVWLVFGLATANTGGDEAKEVGTAIGAALVFALWVGVDFILGVGYGIYKLATRK